MIVRKRVKRDNKTIGYIIEDNGKSIFINIDETYKYKPKNAIRIKNGAYNEEE